MKSRRIETIALSIYGGMLCVEYGLDRLDIKVENWLDTLILLIKSVSVIVGIVSFFVYLEK